MTQKKEKDKVVLREVCSLCRKPVGGKASSDVTRYLSLESRCSCIAPTTTIREAEPDDAPSSDESEAAEPRLSVDDAQANLGEDYEVLEVLGFGGMGVVFKARDLRLNKTFAIKVLNPELVTDAQSVKRFQQEARAASSLTHVNLSAVYTFGLGKRGAPFLVMDYLDGHTVGDLIQKEGYLDVPRALDIFIQTTEALVSAHGKGVVHRDIKPNNIMVCETDGVELVKLLDFGIAKVLPNEASAAKMTQTGEIFGSPLYMSPEQCLGNKIDARSDLYGLGCVMYEVLTGIAPFAAVNPIKTILNHVNEAPIPLSKLKHDFGIPADLEKVILHCLEKDPTARYGSADTLLADLRAVRDGKKISLKAQKKNNKGGSKVFLSLKMLGFSSVVLLMAILVGLAVFPRVAENKDPYTEADTYDARSAAFFAQGEYDKAIDLLMFNLHTYKMDGNPRHESYLADCTQHVGKCYLKKQDYVHAQKYYRDALKIYQKWGGYSGGMMAEAVTDYEAVLRGMGYPATANKMLKDWSETRTTRGDPNLRQIP